VIHPSARARTQCSAVETEVFLVLTARLEIRTGIDLETHELAMDPIRLVLGARGSVGRLTPPLGPVPFKENPICPNMRLAVPHIC
jgi:hypothetical protein